MTRRKGWPRSDNYYPSVKKVAESQAMLRFDVHEVSDDRVGAFLAVVGGLAEGADTPFVRLRLQADPVAQMLISTGRATDYGLREMILTSETLRNALPELGVRSSLDVNINWAPWNSGFAIAGDLAESMNTHLSDAESMQLSNDFVLAVTGGRYSDFEMHKTYYPWSPFWDQDHDGAAGMGSTTWLMLDRRNGDVSCLFSRFV